MSNIEDIENVRSFLFKLGDGTELRLVEKENYDKLVERIKKLELKQKEMCEEYCPKVEKIKELEEALLKVKDKNTTLFITCRNSIPKQKVKEIFNRLHINDIEPWSFYKVSGEILFDLKELLEDK